MADETVDDRSATSTTTAGRRDGMSRGLVRAVRRGLWAVGGQPLLRPAGARRHRPNVRDQLGHRRAGGHLRPDRVRRSAWPCWCRWATC